MFVHTLVSYSVEQKALIENNSTPMVLDATSFSLLIRVLICGKLLNFILTTVATIYFAPFCCCSIDATKDDGSFGRLINHSKKAANVTPKVLEVRGIPSLYFEAMQDITSGEEILCDYNDTRKITIKHHPWLSS